MTLATFTASATAIDRDGGLRAHAGSEVYRAPSNPQRSAVARHRRLRPGGSAVLHHGQRDLSNDRGRRAGERRHRRGTRDDLSDAGVSLNLKSSDSFAIGGELTLDIDGFVQIAGGFAMTSSVVSNVKLSDKNVPAKDYKVTTFALGNLDAFVGAGPYFVDENHDGIIDATPNPDAAGLLLKNATIALVLLKPTTAGDPGKYYALSASADTIQIAGLILGGSDTFGLSAKGYRIEVNGGTNNVAVDFTSLPNEMLRVRDEQHCPCGLRLWLVPGTGGD